MPSRQKNRMARACFGEGVIVKRVFEKYTLVLQAPEAAGEAGPVAIHDFTGQHVDRNHDHQVGALLRRFSAPQRHKCSNEEQERANKKGQHRRVLFL